MNEQSAKFSIPALRGGVAALAAVVLVALTFGVGCSGPPQGFEQTRCDEEGAVSNNGQRRCLNGFWVRPDFDIGVDADTGDTGQDVDAGPLPPGEDCVMDRECISGVCQEETCAEPSCSDAVRNGEETDLDCGGPDCGPCEPERDCKVSGDCSTGVCTDGTCREATCDDDTLNGDETDVDCGDPDCGPCEAGKACNNRGDCQSGVCGEEGTCQPPACDDEVKNGEETAVDCGGPDCSGCDLQESCQTVDDCKSGDNIVCAAGSDGEKVCQMVTCMDDTQNGDETDVDCGGEDCAPCVVDDSCREDSDCESKVCTNNICQVASCSDGVQNRDETDVDCGGSFCKTLCMVDEGCGEDADCQTGVCGMDGTCNMATCSDGTRNGAETDIDCGGPDCNGCATSARCMSDSDCQSRVCTNNSCAAPTCMDDKRNGSETGEDCGGPDCPKCGRQVRCLQDSDCLSGICSNMTCAVPNCMDGVQNGQETDVDCGGPNCSSTCAQGEGCNGGGDCQSGVCGSNDTCQAPRCTDGVQNGQETAVDCGGPDCGTCVAGKSCGGDGDCDSGVCNMSGVCEAATCMDGVQNGQETDVDCGGSTCSQCLIGESCSIDGDCTSGWCDGGTCKVRIVGDLTSNNPGSWSDGSVAPSCEAYRRPTQTNYVYAFAGSAQGDGLYEVQSAGMSQPTTVYCDMTTDGGGWTMVIISAGDGTTTWTWSARTLFTTDTTTFGDVTRRSEDYKTAVYHNLTFADVLVEHTGGDWAAYNGVGDGSETLATHIEQISSGSECYGNGSMNPNQVRPGTAMSAGTLQTSGTDLCSTDLYFNAGDQDGNSNCNDTDGTYGPSWSVNENDGCPMDDPGRSGSFGPEESNPQQELQAQGFGQAIGAVGSGSAVRLFIR